MTSITRRLFLSLAAALAPGAAIRNARRDLMDMAKELGVDLLAGQKGKIEDVLSPGHDAILKSYFNRRLNPEKAPPQRVIAPPELLDGIVPHITRQIQRPPPKP